jgi:hypothetical protein
MPEKPLNSFLIPRRLPGAEKAISEITKNDTRVSILGTVIEKNENIVILDDGSGRAEIKFEEPVDIEIGQIARVFGRVIPMENGFEIYGEIMQDMSKIDINLYRKVNNMWREVDYV